MAGGIIQISEVGTSKLRSFLGYSPLKALLNQVFSQVLKKMISILYFLIAVQCLNFRQLLYCHPVYAASLLASF